MAEFERGRMTGEPNACSTGFVGWSQGLRYEADPRHPKLLANPLGLEQCKVIDTPGVKWPDDVHDGPVHNEHLQELPAPDDSEDITDEFVIAAAVNAVVDTRRPEPAFKEHSVGGIARKMLKHVRFDKQPQIFEVAPYSQIYGRHPRTFVFTGPVLGAISQPEKFGLPNFKIISSTANPIHKEDRGNHGQTDCPDCQRSRPPAPNGEEDIV